MKKLLCLLLLLAGILPLSAQQELPCFINDPDVEGKTNIRDRPGGKVIIQVDASDFYQITVYVQPGSWWRIKGSALESYEGTLTLPAGEAWIHRSVLALGTDNSDGHYRFLRTEPRADAPKAGIVREFNAVVRPLEMSQDGKWVKVKYEEGNLTGWIETSWVRDDAFEPGDGYGFPILIVYSIPQKEVSLRSAPGKGAQTGVLKPGKLYEMHVAKPKNGWWEILGDNIIIGEDYIDLDVPSWIPSSALSVSIISPEAKDSVPLYSSAGEKSPLAGRLKVGTVVHPLELHGEYWTEWVKVVSAEDSGLSGWVQESCIDFEPPKVLTYASVAGMYDTADSETRVCLNEDGTATWNMIGSLHWTDFTYIISGNGIYLDVREVPEGAKPDYIYDPEKKTLKDGDGTLYYLQKMD